MKVGVVFLSFLFNLSTGKNILMLTPFAPQSHENIFNAVARVLLDHGHQVTLVSPGKYKVAGATHIPSGSMIDNVTTTAFRDKVHSLFENSNWLTRGSFIAVMVFLVANKITDRCIANENIMSLYKLPPHTYDMVIANALANFCSVPLAYTQDVPLVLLSPSGLLYHTHLSLGNPDLPSISPSPFMDLSDDMTFLERLKNMVFEWMPCVALRLYSFQSIHSKLQNRTGLEFPPIYSMLQETSLVLSNTHHSFTKPRVLLPNMIEIGGINCQPAKSIPQEFETFVGKGGNGFIYFSLGSTTPGHYLPKEKTSLMLRVFKSLPYQVVWKYDKPELIEDVPDNVMLTSWAPQQDLLGHASIKLFITQGGLLSIQEAVYHGVPILGLPIFGDQPANLNRVVDNNAGMMLEWHSLDEASMHSAVLAIINDNRIRRNMRNWSALFHDDIRSPKEKVLFWIEYVLKHKGAQFLRIPGRHLWIFQYYLLDVIAFLSLVLLMVYCCLKYILIILCNICRGKPMKNKRN